MSEGRINCGICGQKHGSAYDCQADPNSQYNRDKRIEKHEKEVLAEINDKKKQAEKLEAFMVAVAKEVKCLPSFADPSPDSGNAHIMRAIRKLTTKRSEDV